MPLHCVRLCIASCVFSALLVVCAFALLVVLQCIARCASSSLVVVCTSALQFHVCPALQVMHSYSVVACVALGVTALVVILPRISQVVEGFNLRKG